MIIGMRIGTEPLTGNRIRIIIDPNPIGIQNVKIIEQLIHTISRAFKCLNDQNHRNFDPSLRNQSERLKSDCIARRRDLEKREKAARIRAAAAAKRYGTASVKPVLTVKLPPLPGKMTPLHPDHINH